MHGPSVLTCCASCPSPPCAVLVGSGRRALGALIVPNSEALEELAKERGEHAGLLGWLVSAPQSCCAGGTTPCQSCSVCVRLASLTSPAHSRCACRRGRAAAR